MSLTDTIIDEGYNPAYWPGMNQVGLAEFLRDMSRLDDLLDEYGHPGLNSYESSERDELIDKYDMKHVEWFNQKYHFDRD